MQQTQEQRMRTLGSSDAAAAIGMSTYRSPVDVYLEKTGQIEPFTGNEWTYWGKKLEDIVAQEYAQRKGVSVRRRNLTFHDKQYDWMTCHPDRTVDLEQTVLECKIANWRMAGKFGDEEETDEVPEEYLIQVYHQMMVMDYPFAHLAVLIDNHDFRIYHFERNDELMMAIRERELEFWECVLTETPPPPSSEADVDKLWRIHTGGEYVEASEHDVAALARLSEIAQQSKDLDEEKEGLRTQLKDVIRSAEGLQLDGKTLCTWKSHERTTIDTKRLKEESPDLAESYETTNTVRQFRLKK